MNGGNLSALLVKVGRVQGREFVLTTGHMFLFWVDSVNVQAEIQSNKKGFNILYFHAAVL